MLITLQISTCEMNHSFYLSPTTEEELDTIIISFKPKTCKLMFSIHTNTAPQPLINQFQLNRNVHHHHTRQQLDYHIPPNRNNWATQNITYQGPKQWLVVPQELKSLHSTKAFNQGLKRYIVGK